ncbi:MAG TPA: glycine--tRNA ligase subunit beta, partial [Polyangiaceae bacterium]|nr:glycine--tRNA ligase subunit beta [Polyangiaceae bacterium]
MSQDLLLEIGVEELPASFVAHAVEALPGLLESRLRELRLSHGALRALGTPRRLTLLAEGIAEAQPDLDEEVLGPPARVAFDSDGKPTKAAQSFASKIGVALDALTRKA